MKHKEKTVLNLALAGALTLSLAACGGKTASTPAPAPTSEPAAPVAEATPTPTPTATPAPTPTPTPEPEDDAFHLNFTVPIPEKYQDLLVSESFEPNAENNGLCLTVSEKASVEAGKKTHPGEDWGDGWLFSLGVVDEPSLRQMVCYDMSGVQPVGDMGNGYWLIYYHPTDVRLMREGEYTDADMAQWSELNDWAAGIPNEIVKEAGLTPYTRTNTNLDMYLNRMAYLPEEFEYTFSSLEYGQDLKPSEKVDSETYLDKLLDGLTVEWLEDGEFPDGQYTVLKFPENEDVRYDFSEVDGNLVREVMGDYETVYRLQYENGSTVAGDVLRDWCAALAG